MPARTRARALFLSLYLSLSLLTSVFVSWDQQWDIEAAEAYFVAHASVRHSPDWISHGIESVCTLLPLPRLYITVSTLG